SDGPGNTDDTPEPPSGEPPPLPDGIGDPALGTGAGNVVLAGAAASRTDAARTSSGLRQLCRLGGTTSICGPTGIGRAGVSSTELPRAPGPCGSRGPVNETGTTGCWLAGCELAMATGLPILTAGAVAGAGGPAGVAGALAGATAGAVVAMATGLPR